MAATGRASLARLRGVVSRCLSRPSLPRSNLKLSAFSRPRSAAAELGRHAYALPSNFARRQLPTLLGRGGGRPTRMCSIL
ncbi:hypothetical protein FA95DRAFT_1568054 [Auriscalpium vulgare]|uniref:Uncharacterized protein n=1 Tax=Auriscalpium vulgare TaxID=40419 RepID=A0ACB8R1M5_9AGAM|nr:hypothetical protein FA95DRAFT_1568054 [Auriscalpium vulgare]